MTRGEKFAAAFMIAFVVIFGFIWAVSAHAQETRLKPVATLNCTTKLIPSPEDKEHMIVYDCQIPAGTTIPVNIYGLVYPGSNLKLVALYDEEQEGYGHRVLGAQVQTIEAQKTTNYVKWNFPVKHIALLRQAETTSSNYGYQVTPQNGLPDTIDSVTVGLKGSYIVRYGRTFIRSTNGLKTIR